MTDEELIVKTGQVCLQQLDECMAVLASGEDVPTRALMRGTHQWGPRKYTGRDEAAWLKGLPADHPAIVLKEKYVPSFTECSPDSWN